MSRVPPTLDAQLQAVLAPFGLRLAILFGSVARGAAGAHSDLDLAVQADAPLDADQKMALIDALGRAFGRPVDLIDLRRVGEPLLGAILAEGRRVVGDSSAWADLLSRHLVNQADFVPLQAMILRRRLQSWTKH